MLAFTLQVRNFWEQHEISIWIETNRFQPHSHECFATHICLNIQIPVFILQQKDTSDAYSLAIKVNRLTLLCCINTYPSMCTWCSPKLQAHTFVPYVMGYTAKCPCNKALAFTQVWLLTAAYNHSLLWPAVCDTCSFVSMENTRIFMLQQIFLLKHPIFFFYYAVIVGRICMVLLTFWGLSRVSIVFIVKV